MIKKINSIVIEWKIQFFFWKRWCRQAERLMSCLHLLVLWLRDILVKTIYTQIIIMYVCVCACMYIGVYLFLYLGSTSSLIHVKMTNNYTAYRNCYIFRLNQHLPDQNSIKTHLNQREQPDLSRIQMWYSRSNARSI